MKNFTSHLPHYMGLLGLFAAGVVAFLLFSYDRLFQISVIVAVAIGYVVWGIIHHKIHRDFHPSVVIEYMAVAILGLVIVFALVFNL
jgi:EamA domain-containing membrane protein RarD